MPLSQLMEVPAPDKPKPDRKLEFRDGLKLGSITKGKGADWSKHPDPQVRENFKTARRKYPEEE